MSLSKSYLNKQKELTIKIYKRCKQLGIEIILPSFSGHLPDKMSKLYPNSQFYDGSMWFGFERINSRLTFLDPRDKLYIEIGHKYQMILYETFNEYDINLNNQFDNLYLWLDQYNELDPNSNEPNELTKIGEAQYQSMNLNNKINDKIKWVIQGWMFYHLRSFWSNENIKAYFDKINSDNILILDLIAEKGSAARITNGFFNHSYIWCLLHNFGGDIGIGGNFNQIFESLKLHDNINLKGIGISMEGINHNIILFHSVLYHSFMINNKPIKKKNFLKQFILSRYGKKIFKLNNNEINEIWKKFIFYCI